MILLLIGVGLVDARLSVYLAKTASQEETVMGTTWPALLMPFLAVLPVLAFPHAPAAAHPDDHDDARLWVAHGGRLLQLPASGAILNKFGRDVRTVAADPVRNRHIRVSRSCQLHSAPPTSPFPETSP